MKAKDMVDRIQYISSFSHLLHLEMVGVSLCIPGAALELPSALQAPVETFPWELTAKISVVSILIWGFCLDKNSGPMFCLAVTHALVKVGFISPQVQILSCNLPWLQQRLNPLWVCTSE